MAAGQCRQTRPGAHIDILHEAAVVVVQPDGICPGQRVAGDESALLLQREVCRSLRSDTCGLAVLWEWIGRSPAASQCSASSKHHQQTSGQQRLLHLTLTARRLLSGDVGPSMVQLAG